MNEIEQAKHRKDVFRQRIREAKRCAAATVEPAERRRQRERVRILTDMYRDACDELARLEGRTRAGKRREVALSTVFNKKAVWSDLAGMSWSGSDHVLWGDILAARQPGAATGRQYQLLVQLLNDAMFACTERQRQLIHAYYVQNRTMPDLAAELSVDKSVISRTIKRGLSRVGHQVLARLTIAPCINDSGKFDYLKFVRSTALLTERQTELLYLALTRDASYTMMSAYIGRNVSTVSRTLDRMEARLSAVRVDLLPEMDVSGVKFRDWAGLDEITLAKRLGLQRKFFYSCLHRGETCSGLPLLHYHALCRLRSGWTARETARELGTGEAWCRNMARRYQNWDGPLDLINLPPYTPDQVKHTVQRGTILAALRDLTRGGDEIIDRIDGQIFARLQAMREGDEGIAGP